MFLLPWLICCTITLQMPLLGGCDFGIVFSLNDLCVCVCDGGGGRVMVVEVLVLLHVHGLGKSNSDTQ
jgi:hypothetical protein